MKCPLCQQESEGLCPSCPSHLVRSAMKLAICRTNVCEMYDHENGKDRCCMVAPPCSLADKLRRGFECRDGWHDDVP